MKKKMFIVIALMVMLVFIGLIMTWVFRQELGLWGCGCTLIYGDGYGMGTDIEPIAIGEICGCDK